MHRPTAGEMRFYHRDSDGTAERILASYMKWVARIAETLGVKYCGTFEDLKQMIKQSLFHKNDIYLDYGVRGRKLDRLGLNALVRELGINTQISHVLMVRRDRLSRPKDPLEPIELENKIRRMGVTIVYQDRTLDPIRPTQRVNVAETSKALHEFDDAGETSRILACKMIQAKLASIDLVSSIGGTPPYGFERWLVGPNDTEVRKLELHERVKLREHFIRWLPKNLAQIQVVIRIFELSKTMSCTDIAEVLTVEGVPPPYSWRSGNQNVWYRSTVRNIINNPLYSGIWEYGKRGGGDYLRMTPEGFRELFESELDDNQDGKQTINPVNQRIRKTLPIPLVVDIQSQLKAIATVQQRRGKPRQQKKNFNPLGGRVYDMTCGWSMYRKARNGKFCYTCGAYMQSDGALCNHNSVEGIKAASFVAKMIRQVMLPSGRLQRLKDRIHELAMQEIGPESSPHAIKQLRSRAEHAEKAVKIASRNLALAETAEERQELLLVFSQLKSEHRVIEDNLKSAEDRARMPNAMDKEVEMAMKGFDRLKDLLEYSTKHQASSELFKLVNAYLYVGFENLKRGNKKVNRIDGGIVTLGSSQPPIPIHTGPVDKAIVKTLIRKGGAKSLLVSTQAVDNNSNRQQGSERGMLGNVQRRTPDAPASPCNDFVSAAGSCSSTSITLPLLYISAITIASPPSPQSRSAQTAKYTQASKESPDRFPASRQ